MADKYQREIPLDDEALFALVQEKGQLVDGGRALAAEMEAIAKQHQELMDAMDVQMTKVNELKLRIFKRVRELAAPLLTEFEIPVTTQITAGKLTLVVTEGLEEFKDSFKGFDKWTEPVPKKRLDAKQTEV
jgi:hypothetical protein